MRPTGRWLGCYIYRGFCFACSPFFLPIFFNSHSHTNTHNPTIIKNLPSNKTNSYTLNLYLRTNLFQVFTHTNRQNGRCYVLRKLNRPPSFPQFLRDEKPPSCGRDLDTTPTTTNRITTAQPQPLSKSLPSPFPTQLKTKQKTRIKALRIPSSNILKKQIQNVFRAIGRTLMAIINGIGGIIMAIVNGVITVLDTIIGFLTCNTCGGRRRHHTTTGRRGFGRRRHVHTTTRV